MGQITTETIAMIRRAVDANQAPPLTLWEFRQLAFLAEKQITKASPLTYVQRRSLIDRAGDLTDGLNQDDFADEIVKLVEAHHGVATKQAEAPTASNEREALHTVLDRFEAKERGIPQSHIAAQLVAELRAALATQQEAPTVSNERLTDDEVFALIDKASAEFRRSQSGVRGNMMMPSDDPKYVLVRVVEAALATQQEAQPQAEPTEWPTVPDRVMELVQVYGDARADDKHSGVRLSELIYALRQWAGTLKAAQAEPAGGDKEDAERLSVSTLTRAIQSIKGSTYNLTKDECIFVLENLRDDAARAAQQATWERT